MPDSNDRTYLPFGPDQSATPVLPPSMEHHALNLYHRAWEDYRNAGSPFGETDEAMLVWYSLSPGRNVIGPVTSRN